MFIRYTALPTAFLFFSSCTVSTAPATSAQAQSSPPTWNLIPGMPAYPDPNDIYSAGRPGLLSPVVKDFPADVYVPQNRMNRVSVIDQTTFKVLHHFPTEREPQHVTPSWDLKTL